MSKGSNNYVSILGAVSPSVRTGSRAADIVAALTPPAKTPDISASLKKKTEPDLHKAKESVIGLAPGVVGAAVGYFIAPHKQKIPGILVGHALGSTALPLWSGNRRVALCQLAVEGAGVLGLLFARSRKAGYLGQAGAWAAGIAAGMVATSFVPGSPAQEELAKIKARAAYRSRRVVPDPLHL